MTMVINHRIIASEVSVRLSWSRARRRECISHANVRSTSHLFGSTTKPVVSSVRLTTVSAIRRTSRARPTRRPV